MVRILILITGTALVLGTFLLAGTADTGGGK